MTDAAEGNLDEHHREELLKRWTTNPNLEMWITSPSDLSALIPDLLDWQIPGFAKAHALLDKTGEVEQSLSSIRQMPKDAASAAVNGWSGAYTNALFRSVKAYRRGDELGARLHAAESLIFLTKALFALERRWTPYHDRLFAELGSLEGWEGPPLAEYFLNLLEDPRAEVQIELFEHVRSHLRGRDVEFPAAKWDESLERVGITKP